MRDGRQVETWIWTSPLTLEKPYLGCALLGRALLSMVSIVASAINSLVLTRASDDGMKLMWIDAPCMHHCLRTNPLLSAPNQVYGLQMKPFTPAIHGIVVADLVALQHHHSSLADLSLPKRSAFAQFFALSAPVTLGLSIEKPLNETS